MRIVWSLLGLLAVIIVVAFVYASTLITKAVETGGSKVLGVPVTLAMAKVEPFSGEMWLKDLTVANPEGYKTENAFTLGEVYVKLNLASVLEKTVIVEQIAVRAPKATFEGDYVNNNFNQLYKNIQANTAQPAEEAHDDEHTGHHEGETAEEHAAHAHEGHDHAPKKVILKDFVFEGAMVKAVLNTPVGQKSVDKQLPDLRLTNIGQAEGGLTIEETAKRIIQPIQKEIQRVSHGAMDELKGVLQNGVDTFKSRVKSLADDVKTLF